MSKKEHANVSEEIDGIDSIRGKLNQRKQERNNIVWSTKSKIGYAWDIFRNLLILLIWFAVFDSLHDSFEAIVVALLAFILVSITSFAGMQGQLTARNLLVTNSQLFEIKRMIGKDDLEDEEKELRLFSYQLDKGTIKFYINSIFNFLILILAFLSLVNYL